LMSWAKESRDETTLKVLASWEIDPNRKRGNGLAPIHAFLSNGESHSLPAFKAFLEWLKPDIHLSDANGSQPLAYAAGHADPAFIQLLVQAGGDVSHRDNDGDTPLAEAMLAGAYAKIPSLLSAGAKPEDAFRGDWKALAKDVKDGKAKERFAELALKDGASPSSTNTGAIWTQGALVTAILKGDLDFIKAVEATGVDLSVPWRKGLEPFEVLRAYHSSKYARHDQPPLLDQLKPVNEFALEWARTREAKIKIRVRPETARTNSGQYVPFNAEVKFGNAYEVKWQIEGAPKDASINPEGVFTASQPGLYRALR
jgi:hypothetical protein